MSERGSDLDAKGDARYAGELATKVEDLFLSVRTRNVLRNAGIEYVGDLVQLTEGWLLSFQNCGRKTVTELREKLAELGLELGMSLVDWDRPNTPRQLPLEFVASKKQKTLADFDDDVRAKLLLRVDEGGFSQRAQNALKAGRIEFVGDLVGKTHHELQRLKSCGRLTIFEIQKKLNALGLELGTHIADWSTAAARAARERQDGDPQSPLAISKRGLTAIPPSEYLEDELREILASVGNERGTELAQKQLGWSGLGHRTLESVGQEYSLTRERVRQIVARKTEEIEKEYLEAPRLDEALAVVRDRCPASASELAAELRIRGVSKGDFDPTGLQTACDVLRRVFPIERVLFGDTKVYVAGEQAERIGEFFRLCRKLTSSRGCANFDAVCDELRIPDIERGKFRELVTIESMCEWLDADRRWLVATGVTRNRLSNLAAKALSVAPHVYLGELRRAVARSRRLAVVPPAGVLARFLERYGLANVSDGRAFAAGDFSDAVRPGSAEAILVSVLRKHGPLLAWERFRELSISAGMNPITFGIYVSGSPVVTRLARGIYSLIGADIPPGAVEDLEREVAAARKPAEWGWSPRGTLWYALQITGAILAGAVTVPRFVGDLVEGEWRTRFAGRELEGDVKCRNGFLWGYRRALVNAAAEPGDVVVFEFDLSKRNVDITLGGEELIDLWDSGDIDLPAPDSAESDADLAQEQATEQ